MGDAPEFAPSAIPVDCPLCGALHLFADPPVIRSAICGHCDRYVCESEWHEAFMERVALAVGMAATSVQEARGR